MAIPALVVYTQEAMADKVARALNLAADRDLFNSADGGALFDLVDKCIVYVDDCQGTAPPFSPTL